MLNIGGMIGVDVNVKRVESPILFFDGRNVCTHCAGENTLKFVDIFGRLRDSNEEIHAFDHIKCTKCGKIFSIEWRYDATDMAKMYPIAVDMTVEQEFQNLIHHKDLKDSGATTI